MFAKGWLQLGWPSGATFYRLQTASSLTPPITWQDITTGLTDDGQTTSFPLAISPAPQSQFFRLETH